MAERDRPCANEIAAREDTDDKMALAMEQRQSRHATPAAQPVISQRTCEYCYQPDDHETAVDCARASER
jgi:hypothetical protein